MRRVAALAIAVLALLWVQRLAASGASPSSGTALALGFTLLGASIAGDVLRRVQLPRLTGYLLFVLLNVLAGVALGALLQSSATAIAASFALPAAFALLGAASTLVADWIDMSTWNWVLENEWEGHVPQISVSVLFWVAVPLAAGVVRTIRRDVT